MNDNLNNDMNNKYCEKCGNALKPNSQFCEKCGKSTRKNDIDKEPGITNKEKIIIGAVLVIILLLVIIWKPSHNNNKYIPKTENKSQKENINSKTIDDENQIEEKKEEDLEKEAQSIADELRKKDKEIVIYYEKYENSTSYFCDNHYHKDAKVKKTFTCKTSNCQCLDVSKDHILVKENDKYYVYNYTEDKLLVSDFTEGYLFKEDDESEIGVNVAPYLVVNDKGEAIAAIYTKNDDSKIYSVYTNKIYSNIKGHSVLGPDFNNTSEFNNKGLLYLTNYDNDSDSERNFLFDLRNGKIVFNNLMGISYVGEDYFITSINKSFTIYDYNMKKTFTSKKYTEVLKTGKDYALVVEEAKLNLIDLKGNLLTTFLTDYNDDKYTVHTLISGWYEQNGKNGIYIVIGQSSVTVEEILKDNPNMNKKDVEDMLKASGYETEGAGYEYYYIPTTKETGKIATVIGGYAKPVLYLYPEEKANITVSFEHNNWLTTTYPKFINGWNVVATKDGNLKDKDGRNYYALYWEEIKNHDIDFKEGFYVEGKDAIKFLEEKLEIIGLNERESNEFIMYWLPILENNKKNLIYFELTEEREAYNKLIINPKPDSILRMAMHVKKVDKKINIKEQKLETFNRTGFSAVEWGGVIH